MLIIARGGWTTYNLNNAIDSYNLNSDWNLVSLLIGVNNQYQGFPVEDYPDEFEELLRRAISFANGDIRSVFVLSIPDYGYTPFGSYNQEEISREIDLYNQINKGITQDYGVHYVDVTKISRNGLNDPELIARDGLHPSGKMYTLWVEKIMAAIIRSNLPSSSYAAESSDIVLYPTIISDKLNVAGIKSNATLRIYNFYGSLVYDVPISSDKVLNLEHLPAGFYIVKLLSENGSEFSDLIVKQ